MSEEVLSAPEVATAPDASVSQNATASNIAAVKPRQAFRGKVTRVDLGGAFVDIGVGVDAYIHISQIASEGPITRVADVLKVGDEIQVYVAAVDPQTRRIGLTMTKPPTYDWSDLQIGLKIANVRVVSLESFGAFVDIDGPKHGLVPFNLMPKGKRPKVGDILDAVWVIEVNEEKRRIGLTMIEPPALPWEKIHRGDTLTGVVTRIERKGAFVDVGAEREGLIRSSSFGSGFVNISDYLSVNERVSVRVIKVDPAKKQLDLAMEGINPEDFELSSGPDEILSPMQAAFQRAQRSRRNPEQHQSRTERKLSQQDEILARTLKQLQSQRNK
ncbi:MAG: S1 RNA-binding domain-containing protein [Anaerolineae bacterium]|nr:S1 RNA-binding domain-containing protein [Thermoflexales bacterium]MDW8408445.1 S1 RNA-binding domain-containing protein [Anaerolineae bacterium]